MCGKGYTGAATSPNTQTSSSTFIFLPLVPVFKVIIDIKSLFLTPTTSSSFLLSNDNNHSHITSFIPASSLHTVICPVRYNFWDLRRDPRNVA